MLACTAPRQFKHLLAQIDVIDGRALRLLGKIRLNEVLLNQLDEKAPIAFAEHKGPFRIGDVFEKRITTAFERAAEADVLEPPVPASDRVAIHSQVRRIAMGRNSAGVNKATSARTRKAFADNRSSARSSSTNANALAVSAPARMGR